MRRDNTSARGEVGPKRRGAALRYTSLGGGNGVRSDQVCAEDFFLR
jgi:hypothetical protein